MLVGPVEELSIETHVVDCVMEDLARDLLHAAFAQDVCLATGAYTRFLQSQDFHEDTPFAPAIIRHLP